MQFNFKKDKLAIARRSINSPTVVVGRIVFKKGETYFFSIKMHFPRYLLILKKPVQFESLFFSGIYKYVLR